MKKRSRLCMSSGAAGRSALRATGTPTRLQVSRDVGPRGPNTGHRQVHASGHARDQSRVVHGQPAVAFQ